MTLVDTAVGNMKVSLDSGGNGKNNLRYIRSSPHFHTCAHLARTQVWLSAHQFRKVTVIGPILSKQLREAFHHLQTVQTDFWESGGLNTKNSKKSNHSLSHSHLRVISTACLIACCWKWRPTQVQGISQKKQTWKYI